MIAFLIAFILFGSIQTLRGGVFHAFLVAQTATAFRRVGFRVWLEFPLRLSDGRVDALDILAQRGPTSLACEIETTARHAHENMAKCQGLGLLLWIVVPTRKVARAVLQSRTPDRRTLILLPGEVPQALTSCFPDFPAAYGAPENGKTPRSPCFDGG